MSEQDLITPTQKFYNDVFGCLPKQDLKRSDIPELIEVLRTFFNARDVSIVQMRYGIGVDDEAKTLKETGIAFGLGTERPRQIIAKIIRKLRHPSKSKSVKILFMSNTELREKVAELEIKAKCLAEELDRAEREREAIMSSGIAKISVDQPNKVSIEHLGFSIRAYRCLVRGGVYTLADLLEYSRKSIAKIRGLGSAVLSEIELRLTALGLQLNDAECEE